MKVVEGLYYSEDHEWVKVDGDFGYVGITDFAQHELGEIVYVELPFADDVFDKGDVFGVLESVKAASDSYTPISGEVVEVNEELEMTPNLINEEPYDTWIFKIKLTDKSELEELMDAEEYEEFCNEEE